MSSENKSLLASFNLVRFIVQCFKSWYVFALTMGACLLLAVAFVVIKRPKAEIVAQLVLKEDQGGSSMMMAGQIARSFSLGDMFGGSSSTDNETFVLKSHTVFEQTARQMDLNVQYAERRLGILWSVLPTKSPLRLVTPAGISDTLTTAIKFTVSRNGDGTCDVKVKVKRKTVADVKDKTFPIDVQTKYGNFVIDKTQYYNDEDFSRLRITLVSYDAAACGYEELVKVFVPDRKSEFIDLSFVTPDAEFGKSLLNHIIDNYMDISNVYNNQRSTQSLRLVDDRLMTLSQELVQSEHDLEKFKSDHDLTDLAADAQYMMAKTGSLEGAILQAQTNLELVTMTRNFLSNPENNFSLIPDMSVQTTSVSQGENASSLIHQYNQMILRRMQLMVSAKESNDKLQQLDQQIEALRANIVTSVNRLHENVLVALNDLKAEQNKNKLRLSEIPAMERQYLVLKRDNMLQEQIYLFLLQQREELNMSLASRAMPAQIIDAPYALPQPAGLSPYIVIALALFIGLLAGAAYVLLVIMKRTPINALSEADSLITAPTLSAIPEGKTSGIITHDMSNAEAFRMLRSDVQFALDGCDGKSVVVTSVKSGEGKTYVAANLAVSLALIGRKVVIVDTDLSSPGVCRALGVKDHGSSLIDYVYAGAPLTTDTVPVGNDATLHVVGGGHSSINSSDLVGSERFAALIDKLRDEYDYIVIDSSRIDGFSDIFYLTALTDMTIVVCRKGVVTPIDIEKVNTLYRDGRLKRIAVVENGFSR